jgi:hypothetical protein
MVVDVVSRHRRFALHRVTYAGVGMPAATIDCWQDPGGQRQWSARIVTRSCPEIPSGELAGETADGRRISGLALIADRLIGPGGRRDTLVVFHGTGILHGFID